MMIKQTFMKTLVVCSLFMLGVESGDEAVENLPVTVSKGDATPNIGIPTDLEAKVNVALAGFEKDPLFVFAQQIYQLERIATSYIAWESTTAKNSPEYKTRILPYVKLIACFQRSCRSHIQYFKECYEDPERVKAGIVKAVGKTIVNFTRKAVKGNWGGAIWSVVKKLPAMWNRYKIQFKEGKIEDFLANKKDFRQPSKIFERVLGIIQKVKFLEVGAIAKFLVEFKKDMRELHYLLISLKKEAVKDGGLEITGFQEQYIMNNENAIQLLQYNINFSRQQYDLRDKTAIFAVTGEELAEGDDIYHKGKQMLGTVTAIEDGLCTCKFNRVLYIEAMDIEEIDFTCEEDELTKVVLNIEQVKTQTIKIEEVQSQVITKITYKGEEYDTKNLERIRNVMAPKKILAEMLTSIQQQDVLLAHKLDATGGLDNAVNEINVFCDSVAQLKRENTLLRNRFKVLEKFVGNRLGPIVDEHDEHRRTTSTSMLQASGRKTSGYFFNQIARMTGSCTPISEKRVD